jgi:hypothetical protein
MQQTKFWDDLQWHNSNGTNSFVSTYLFSISDVKANGQTQTLLFIFFYAYCLKVRKKVNVYLSSLMMKVPDHVQVYVLG